MRTRKPQSLSSSFPSLLPQQHYPLTLRAQKQATSIFSDRLFACLFDESKNQIVFEIERHFWICVFRCFSSRFIYLLVYDLLGVYKILFSKSRLPWKCHFDLPVGKIKVKRKLTIDEINTRTCWSLWSGQWNPPRASTVQWKLILNHFQLDCI